MTQPVLCAVDISNGLEDVKVVKRAKQIADLDGTGLDVITVLPDFGMSIVGTYFSSDHHAEAVSKAKKLLNDLVTAAIGDEANAAARHIVATGNAYEKILQTAKSDSAQLIVIGAHKPDLKDYLLGPNAARVVRHSECSVYVVR
ncbi:universal stress protein [Pseudoruegeria sp. HB172150]|uniref:universal stress protein n=1 Tax=Pseudoruegeria sp. HB172150 TaxID=2721164 RepID=UPI0015575DF6|nr:universal stress protein [Pseudoruegeria sp. HB172150]